MAKKKVTAKKTVDYTAIKDADIERDIVSVTEGVLTLPPVAKSIYYFCKKCDTDRYHTVLSHTNTISAKITCEVCKSKKTYKITDPDKEKKKKATRKRVTKAATHEQSYESLMGKIGTADKIKYTMKKTFEMDTALDHPKFGLGFVTNVKPDKIEVCFAEEAKLLVHNRS